MKGYYLALNSHYDLPFLTKQVALPNLWNSISSAFVHYVQFGKCDKRQFRTNCPGGTKKTHMGEWIRAPLHRPTGNRFSYWSFEAKLRRDGLLPRLRNFPPLYITIKQKTGVVLNLYMTKLFLISWINDRNVCNVMVAQIDPAACRLDDVFMLIPPLSTFPYLPCPHL